MNSPAARPDFDTYKVMPSADVWKGERLAATLTRTQSGTEFAYTDDYLARPGLAVATTLPVTDETLVTPAGAVPPYFAGLLPEGRRLSSLRRAAKTSADDDLTLLLAVGADPVGDVKVLPPGTLPSKPRALVEVDRDWDEVSFSEVMADAGVEDPIALAGVQDKASARMLSLPVAQSGRRFILKIDPPEYPNVVLDEHYFLSLARRAKFPVVNATVVHDKSGRAGLLVERFDRVFEQSTRTERSLPVEDAAQALNIYPGDKYRVTTEQVAKALSDICSSRPLALREIYRQVLFAWLTGNGDLHAKNLSVVGDTNGEWRMTPAYDLPSTAPYGDRTLAISVGGRTKGLSRKSLLEFGRQIGLAEKVCESVLQETLNATAPVFAEWSESGLSPFGIEATKDTLRVLQHRRQAAS